MPLLILKLIATLNLFTNCIKEIFDELWYIPLLISKNDSSGHMSFSIFRLISLIFSNSLIVSPLVYHFIAKRANPIFGLAS